MKMQYVHVLLNDTSRLNMHVSQCQLMLVMHVMIRVIIHSVDTFWHADSLLCHRSTVKAYLYMTITVHNFDTINDH